MTALPFKSTKDTLKEAVEARKVATREEAEARALVERLGSKLEGLKATLPGLKTSIEDAERAKREAVDLAALDKISHEDLASARVKVDEAKRTEDDAREMIGAVEAARARADEDLSRAVRARQAADKAFWCEVFCLLQGRIQMSAGADLELAWAACIASGQAHGYVGFLQALYGERELSREKVLELLNQLNREYGSR